MINGHGDDLYKYKHIVANFSSNVHQNTDNTSLIEHLREVLPICTASYPEPEPYRLQRLLAEHHNISPDCVVVTNGATEAIYLIAHLFSGKPVKINEPTFSEYRSASEVYQSTITPQASIRWLCNPNNPTGLVQSEDYDDEILVIDRSYEYYSRKVLPKLTLDDKHLYIYSLTKRYKIPGLRIGYILTSPSIATKIRHIRQPWSVNALAIEAGIWIAQHNFPETINRVNLWEETDRLRLALSQIPGIELEDSDTHFMLLKTPKRAQELKEELAQEFGILIRDASNFKTLSSYHIRVATQDRKANDLLVAALKDKLSAL